MSAEDDARALAAARWWPAPGVARDRLEPWLARAAAALAAGASDRKSGRRKGLFALALEGADPDHLLKVNRYARGASLWRRLRRSKARAELSRALAIDARGIPTPVPVAAGERRRAGLLDACFLLVPLLPGALDLRRVWLECRGDARERRAWVRELGDLALRMHARGVLQEDFAPNNFLWRPALTPRLLAIDFERTRLRAALGVRARRRMLAKLDRHFTGASAAARMRFLLAYSAGDRDAARRWWRRVEAWQPALARRDLAHLVRTATRDGRRFATLARDPWRGWRRRDVDLDAVCAVAERAARDADARTWSDGAHWVRALGALTPRAAAHVWAAAQMLWLRGTTAPRPLALLTRGGASALVFERRKGERLLAELGNDAATRACLALLLDRLLALGMQPDDLARDAFALAGGPAGERHAMLLAPCTFSRRPDAPADRSRRARALAARLVPGGRAERPAQATPPR